MIILTDTFNKKVLSKHRTVIGAVKAQIRHSRKVKNYNGNSSYLWYSITDEMGKDIQEEVEAMFCEWETAMHYNWQQDNGRTYKVKWWNV